MTCFKQKGDQFFTTLARILYTHRFKTLVLVLAGFLALASGVTRLTADVRTEAFLHKTDPSLISYEAFKHQFGNDDLIIIAIDSDQIFTLEFLTTLNQLHQALESEVPYLDDITSLINARNTFGRDDTLHVRDLCDPFPRTAEDIAEIRRRVRANPLYQDLLISRDGNTTCITIKLTANAELDPAALFDGFNEDPLPAPASGPEPSLASAPTQSPSPPRTWLTVAQTGEAVEAVARILETYRDQGLDISLSGTASVNHYLKEILMADTQKFMKLAYLGVIIFLGLMFRRLTGILAPVLIVTLSLVSALSLMALTGVSFKLPTQILPSFILAVGVGYSVHILALFYNRLKTGATRLGAIEHAMGHSGMAVVLTGLTTAAGLFSFTGSEVAPTAELGLFAGAGVFFAMVYTFALLPPLLSFARLPVPGREKPGRGMDTLLECAARIATGYPIPVLTVFSLALVLACLGLPRLNFSHDVLRWLPDTETLRLDSEHIDQRLNGTVTMEIVVDTGKENGLYDPDFTAGLLSAVDRIALIATPEVSTGKAWSIADILKETHKALHNNRPDYYTLPGTRDLTAQELFLFANSGSDDLEDFIDARFSLARISVKLPFIDAISYSRYIDRVNGILKEALPKVDITTTGMIMIYSKVIAAGIRSMGESYIYAFISISIMMVCLLGSLRLGALAMVPNLTPILIILGIAGWLSIPVSLFIMLVGNIAMGLAVDDTIHFMHNFKKHFDRTRDTARAVTQTLVSVGRPMVVTTVVLSMGFFIYLLSDMNHLTHFGLLTGAAIILALAADVFLAPALVTLAFRKHQPQASGRLARAKLPAVLLALALIPALAGPGKSHAGTATEDQPCARAIMEAVDQRDDGDDRTAAMTMILVDKHNHQRIRRLQTFTKDDGPHTWSAMFFLAPVDVRDTGFLSYDIDQTNDDDQWLYLPALHRVKRIASDDKTASFMGSDLSYADMTDRELELYDFSILKQGEVREQPCWIIESIPRTPRVIKDFGYTRSILFVRKDCHVVIRAIHFVKEGKKLKYIDIPKLEKIDGIWTPLEMHVTTKKGKTVLHRTILRYADIQYNQGLSDNIFTTRQLEKGVN